MMLFGGAEFLTNMEMVVSICINITLVQLNCAACSVDGDVKKYKNTLSRDSQQNASVNSSNNLFYKKDQAKFKANINNE